MNLRVQSFDEVTSTNNLVKAAIDSGESEGLVIRALQQNAGYGRQGRGWKSPRGGLYSSWLLRPQVSPRHLPTLSLVVGLAVQEACRHCVAELGGEMGSRRMAVKWPNDVVVTESGKLGFEKLCGISTEAYHGALCVGIGINVCSPDFLAGINIGAEKDAKKSEAMSEATAVMGGVGNAAAEVLQADGATQSTVFDTGRVPFYLDSFCRNSGVSIFDAMTLMQMLDQVFDRLSATFVPYYEQWCQAGFDSFVQRFNECNILSDKPVALVDNLGDTLHQGIVLGVNNDGTLRLQQPDGSETAASSGEVHVRFASGC